MTARKAISLQARMHNLCHKGGCPPSDALVRNCVVRKDVSKDKWLFFLILQNFIRYGLRYPKSEEMESEEEKQWRRMEPDIVSLQRITGTIWPLYSVLKEESKTAVENLSFLSGHLSIFPSLCY